MKNEAQYRKAFIWNMISALTYSGMSLLMTLVVMRRCGVEVCGVFSIAFSSSQMLQTVGTFGMRNYQATDLTPRFRFSDYLISRAVTTLGMAVVCLVYAWVMDFEGEKRNVFFLFCGVKMFEAVSDVLEGAVQQHDRLDCAAQSNFFRTLLILLLFLIPLLLGANLETASWLALLGAGAGTFFLSVPLTRKFEKLVLSWDAAPVSRLLQQCLPLFVAAVTGAYINNAPKVAIELHMNDEAQARFAIIFMPAFVINLVSGFIFRPSLNRMAMYYLEGESARLTGLLLRMVLLDTGVTLAALSGAWLLGVPVLDWVYRVDISEEKGVLLLVVLSGGFCALAGLLCQVLTVIRQQNRILLCYLLTVGMVLVLSDVLVSRLRMFGAAMLYLISMMLLTVLLALIYILCQRKNTI